MSEFAKFSATLGKMTVGDTETKIELVLSMKEVQKNFMFLTNNQKQKVYVSLGDPQVSMQFPDDEQEEPYRVYKADSHGVVEPMDSNQADLFEPVVDEAKVDPHEGKVVVITLNNDENVPVEYIFEILNGHALLPKKFINSEWSGTLSHEGVVELLGLTIEPLENHAGIRYSVEQLLNEFGGELIDSVDGEEQPADDVDNDLNITDDQLDDWEKEIMEGSDPKPLNEVPTWTEEEAKKYVVAQIMMGSPRRAAFRTVFDGGDRAAALKEFISNFTDYGFAHQNGIQFNGSIKRITLEDSVIPVTAKELFDVFIKMEERKSTTGSYQPTEPVDIDTFILTEKPVVEGIEYDFPTLLQRKKDGETWMELAKSIGVPSSQLSSAWSRYKKQVEKMLGDNGAA